MRPLKTTSLIALSLTLNATLPPEAWAVGETTRVSVGSDGTQGNGLSYNPAFSADGRFVAFWSYADNLVAGDTNGERDIFVHDRESGEATLVSVASDGTQTSPQGSESPAISADGRFVGFDSFADDLVSGDTNEDYDIFVYDRLTGETTRVSVASDGTEGNDDTFGPPAISDDSRFVVFRSNASNLVAGDTNGTGDAFVRDRLTGETTRVSIASDGTQSNGQSGDGDISADGRFVAFPSDATNLVAGDTNEFADIFLHDRLTRKTTLVSVTSAGTQAGINSYGASISADGRFVGFTSYASDLVEGDTNDAGDGFLRDRLTGKTTRVSIASDGTEGNGPSTAFALSADGRYVAYGSDASNLITRDTNRAADVFIRDRLLQPAASADLSLDVSDSADPVAPGESFTYTLSVTNTGPDSASKTTLTALIPSGVRLTSAVPRQGRCTGKSIVICRLKNLAPSASTEVALTVENRQASGQLQFQASVVAAPVDPEPINNAAVETTDIAP